MTKKQRAQVVELLRCTADLDCSSIARIADIIGASDNIATVAISARWAVYEAELPRPHDRVIELLEAAQRVEDGEWP